jgi:hypothetical protein
MTIDLGVAEVVSIGVLRFADRFHGQEPVYAPGAAFAFEHPDTGEEIRVQAPILSKDEMRSLSTFVGRGYVRLTLTVEEAK